MSVSSAEIKDEIFKGIKIPEDWKYVSLGSVIKIQGGYAFKSKDFVEEGVPVIRISNINNSIQFENRTTYVKKKSISQDFVAKNGEIFIAMSGATTGKTGIYKYSFPAYINQRVGVFRVLDETKFYYPLLYQLINYKSFKKQLDAKLFTGAQPNISPKNIESITILLPPLNEQQKIAEILSATDEQIEKTEQLIKKTKELKKGLMQQLLTKGIGHAQFKKTEYGEIPEEWKKKKVGELFTFQGGQQPPRKYFSSEYKEGYIRLVQIRDYKTDKYVTYIPKEMAKKFCDETDIMIGRYGPPVFQILRGISGSYNVALIKAVPNEGALLKEYAYYFLCKEELFRLIDQLSQRSSGQTGVDMEALKSYPLPLPPLEEQEKIVDILSSVDDQIEMYQKEKEKQIELKKALMHQLLTGQLRVTV